MVSQAVVFDLPPMTNMSDTEFLVEVETMYTVEGTIMQSPQGDRTNKAICGDLMLQGDGKLVE